MSIVIEQVLGPDEQGVRVLIDHAGERLMACVSADLSRAAAAVGRPLSVELAFERVLGWRVLPEGAAVRHGLFDDPSEPGAVRVVGTVHNILALEDGSSIFDIYVQVGPEFLSLQSSDLPGHPPALHDSVEATVRGLCLYPTWT